MSKSTIVFAALAGGLLVYVLVTRKSQANFENAVRWNDAMNSWIGDSRDNGSGDNFSLYGGLFQRSR